jgi:3'-phosphoadenosine 5'-phosphosulfate (PAPS) 3'-phosphatase
VTNADRAAEELILNDLARLAPGVIVVAEESVGAIGEGFDPARPFFLVDPLDGTRDFVRGGKDFTVNIARNGPRPRSSTVSAVPMLSITMSWNAWSTVFDVS